MREPTFRIEWADGSATEVAYRLLPAIQFDIEDEFDGSFEEIMLSPKAARAQMFALWRWFVLREGDERDHREWLNAVDDIKPVGAMAETIAAAAAAAGGEASKEPPPFPETDSPSESSESQHTPESPPTD